jgi:addiction module RelE/StbE family toxin
MRLAIDERALEDLQDIAAWIGKDRPSSADDMLDALLQAMERLAELPRLGRAGRVPSTYEWVVAPYIIVYRIVQKPMTVIITGVFHAARHR